MGIDIGQLSLWQLSAYWSGWQQAQGAEMDDRLTDAEADELWEFIQ